jgi:hypothetical protein
MPAAAHTTAVEEMGLNIERAVDLAVEVAGSRANLNRLPAA